LILTGPSFAVQTEIGTSRKEERYNRSAQTIGGIERNIEKTKKESSRKEER
jgi:hypothetical protein